MHQRRSIRSENEEEQTLNEQPSFKTIIENIKLNRKLNLYWIENIKFYIRYSIKNFLRSSNWKKTQKNHSIGIRWCWSVITNLIFIHVYANLYKCSHNPQNPQITLIIPENPQITLKKPYKLSNIPHLLNFAFI